MVRGERSGRRLGLASCLVILVGLGATQPARAASTERVSVATDGTQGTGRSQDPGISADGRLVGFYSAASNLVAGDTNGVNDTFIRDRQTGITQRVSISDSGQQGDGDSFSPWMSADGRFVAFRSQASNLVPGDTNGVLDNFVHDRQSGTIERVSVSSAGAQGDGAGGGLSISADGRYVAFRSFASNLVPGDTNGDWDVFVHDRQTDTTERISVSSTGAQGNGDCDYPQISADGRYVAFFSAATNLVPGDTNGAADIFVRDLQTGTTARVSVGSSGAQANGESLGPSISGNGRFVAFRSVASNLTGSDTNGVGDVFLHDRQTGTTERISAANDGIQGNGESYGPSVSADGGFVAYRSGASNLVPGDTNGKDDIFKYDRQARTTENVSVDSSGAQSNGNSFDAATNADGRYVAFSSGASNLVEGDTNGFGDIFLRDAATAAVPPVPTFTGTDPTSPANHSSPQILGSAPAGSTVKLYANPDCAGSPAATGTAADFATPGIVVTVADDSSTTFHATATGAFGITSACSTDSITYVEDSATPSGGQITTSLPTFGLTIPFTVAWGEASDSGSGIKSYDVYARAAPFNGSSGPATLFKSTSGPGSGSFQGNPGNTYCFYVTATDNAGNTSGASALECTALPVDDAAVAASSGVWTRATGQAGYYRGTSSSSSTNGATLSLADVQAKQISLVTTTCPTCGTVQVFQGNTLLKKIRLVSKRGVQTEQVIPVASFSTAHTGTVRIVGAGSGKQVIIDGLGVSGS
jgi:hypothetical protein